VTVIASRSPRTLERLADVLTPFGGALYRLRDPATAELVKCVHNIFNATKISFWNEIWDVCRRLDVSSDDVAAIGARAAQGSISTEYGTRGGQPYGGACLPKDTKGFLGFADDLGLEMPMLAAVDLVNEALLHAGADVDGHRDGHGPESFLEVARALSRQD